MREILRSVLGPVEIQSGCLGCHLYEEDEAAHATLLCSQWETEAALREHVRSDIYRRILAASELSEQPPEFRFHQVTHTRGLEWIHEVRGGPGERTVHRAPLGPDVDDFARPTP